MSEKPPTSYGELANILTALPLLLQETCRQRRAIAVLRWFDTGGAA